MNFVAFHFAGGDAFFSGTALIVAACGAALWPRTAAWKRTIRAAALVGALTVALSATPLPVWLYFFGGATLAACLVSLSLSATDRGARRTRLAGGLTIVLCGAAIACELPYRVTFRPAGPETERYTSLAVIGDSLSAGTGERGERTWPDLLRQRYSVEVLDVSHMGATARSAAAQAERIDSADTLVLIEIGGNDLLGGRSSREFAEDLGRLLETLHRPGRRLVMLELPLPPFYNGFGRAQRRLATRYDVVLVPRRDLARILAAEGATLDGLHLSDRGHELMADMVWRHVGPWLR